MENTELDEQITYTAADFEMAGEDEKQSRVIMRESVGFWKDGFRRFRKNKVAVTSFFVVVFIILISFG